MKKQYAIFCANKRSGELNLAEMFDSSGKVWLPDLKFETETEAMAELMDIHDDVQDISHLAFVILPVWTVDND